MIDLHTHSLLSDGELLPSELIRRAYIARYKAIAITDHVDSSNIDFVIPRIVAAVEAVAEHTELKIIPGAEITHVPPKLIEKLVSRAREFGAKLVVVHGETVVEPVAPGTNSAAIDARADIISHPGLITRENAIKAKENGTALEITSRKGHSLTNGHVAKIAMETGAKLVINTDAHAPEDLISLYRAKIVLRGSGIAEENVEQILANSQSIVDKTGV
ncbi:MAG: histidinol phosphate phosphatase domain-containing protein [Thermodesulfovibrionia bacterium]|nr:histidinol phosphate phosphatase domain-containing protein [Thermodesulfovibrionia bacterium]